MLEVFFTWFFSLFVLLCNSGFLFILQIKADPSKRDTVVLLLQDMLEVVTRDMMVNDRLVTFLTLNLCCNMLDVSILYLLDDLLITKSRVIVTNKSAALFF